MSTTQPIKDKEKLERFRNYYKCEEKRPRNYALIVLALNSALRISDVLALRWEDVYWEKGGSYKEHIDVVEKKTGKKNIFVLNSSAREALELYRSSLVSCHEKQYIFCGRNKENMPLSRSQAFRIVKKAAEKCELNSHISCHSLRKTFGYFAWKNGVPPALLMTIYNHSSYEVTKHYLCIDQVEKDEVYMKNFL